MTDKQHFQAVVGGLISSPSSYYEVQKLLGCGTFGEVTQCRKLATNEMVAIKMLKNRKSIKEAKEEEAVLKRMKELGSDKFNIVRWNCSFTYKGRYCLEFEKLDINLCEFIRKSYFRRLQLAEIRPILKQLATALEFLKNIGIVHADLKPENIMMVDHLWQPLRVKVIDFGLASNNPEAWTGAIVQTLWYRAPEVLLGTPFSAAIDAWSLGCIAAELVLGMPLFPARDEYDMMRHIFHTIGQPPDHLLNAGLYTKHFFCKENAGSETSQWRFMSKAKNFARNLRTIGSLSDLTQMPHNLCQENATIDKLDQECFVDLVKKMLKLDASERITPSQIHQHPFITMSHLVGTFDNSLHVKFSLEMMNYCQTQSSDDVAQATLETRLVEEASDSLGCSSTYHSVPDKGDPDGVSNKEQSFLQSNVMRPKDTPANKRKRQKEKECGGRSPDTTPAKRRRGERLDAALTQTEGQASPQNSLLHKRKRHDADPCTSEGNSPEKKRRSVNLNRELMDSVQKLLSNTEESWPSLTPVAHPKNRKRADEEASGSKKEKTTTDKRRSNVTLPENTPANKRKRDGLDDDECGGRSPDTTPAKRRRGERLDAALTQTEGQASPQNSLLHKRKRHDADPCTSEGNSPEKKRSVNLNRELMDSVQKLLSNTEESLPSLTPVAHLKKRKRADEEASGSKKEKISPGKRRKGSLDGGEA